MKNQTKIIILIAVILVVVAVIAIVVINNNKGESTVSDIKTSEQTIALMRKINEENKDILPMVEVMQMDVNDEGIVKSYTGLDSKDDLEFLVVSEPMMSAQAYSFVVAKVKNGKNSSEIARKMSEQIDPRKWICVEADKIYTASMGDIVCLVMGADEMAKPIYDSFKKNFDSIDKEYEVTNESAELPDDLLFNEGL